MIFKLDYGLMIDYSLTKREASRRVRRKAEMRRRIYEAAIALFRNQGYESTTVHDICDVADTAKQTFFNYFPTKDHVLAEYHTRLIESILQEISELSYAANTQAVISAMRVFAAGAQESETLSRTILRHVFASDVLEVNDRENEQKIFSWFHARLRDAVKNGELAPGLNPRLLTTLVMCVLSSTVQEWIGSAGMDLEKELLSRTKALLRLASQKKHSS